MTIQHPDNAFCAASPTDIETRTLPAPYRDGTTAACSELLPSAYLFHALSLGVPQFLSWLLMLYLCQRKAAHRQFSSLVVTGT